MDLSSIYETTRHFYVVAYEDGQGNIELAGEVFTRRAHAEDWITLAELDPFWVNTVFHVKRASLVKDEVIQ